MSLEWAAAAGLGFGFGAVTGMPLGVINVAIVESAAAGDVRFATAVGAGGAIADAAHATLAFLGLGRLVVAQPGLARVLAVVAAAVVVGYAVVTWRQRGVAAAPSRAGNAGHGVVVGVAMTLPNPGALAAWVAVAAAVWPEIAVEDAVVLGASVGVGSAVWFAVLARVVARRRDQRALKVAARAAAVALVVLAVAGAVRAVM